MVLEAKNADLLVQHANHLTSPAAMDALSYLVGSAALHAELRCHADMKGEIRDIRFHDLTGHQPFSAIVNRQSLLFYFRLLAVRCGRYSLTDLQALFDDVGQNNSGEWTVRVSSLEDARKLWSYITATESFLAGSTLTTQIGYINANDQRCGGHRGLPGNDHLQKAYRMECLNTACGFIYGANGSDVFQRKCPKCQGGEPGIAF